MITHINEETGRQKNIDTFPKMIEKKHPLIPQLAQKFRKLYKEEKAVSHLSKKREGLSLIEKSIMFEFV